MKYKVIPSKRFEKDMKRCKKRGYDMQLIKDAIKLLATTGTLPAQYRPHLLGPVCRLLGVPHPARLADDLGAERR